MLYCLVSSRAAKKPHCHSFWGSNAEDCWCGSSFPLGSFDTFLALITKYGVLPASNFLATLFSFWQRDRIFVIVSSSTNERYLDMRTWPKVLWLFKFFAARRTASLLKKLLKTFRDLTYISWPSFLSIIQVTAMHLIALAFKMSVIITDYFDHSREGYLSLQKLCLCCRVL